MFTSHCSLALNSIRSLLHVPQLHSARYQVFFNRHVCSVASASFIYPHVCIKGSVTSIKERLFYRFGMVRLNFVCSMHILEKILSSVDWFLYCYYVVNISIFILQTLNFSSSSHSRCILMTMQSYNNLYKSISRKLFSTIILIGI